MSKDNLTTGEPPFNPATFKALAAVSGPAARNAAIRSTAPKPPEQAEQGDDCGTITSVGAKGGDVICPGTLESYLDVHGTIPGCSCHISPPCGACLDAPLVCNVCKVQVP